MSNETSNLRLRWWERIMADRPDQTDGLRNLKSIAERINMQRMAGIDPPFCTAQVDGRDLAWIDATVAFLKDQERLRTALRRLYDNPPSDPNDTVEIAAKALGILDVRAFGARPAVETSRCRIHGTVFDNPSMGCPRCAAENTTAGET